MLDTRITSAEYSKIKDNIINTYFVDGYIKEKYLKNKIISLFKSNVYLSNKLWIDSMTEQFVNSMIDCFISKEVIVEINDSGILGYRFL